MEELPSHPNIVTYFSRGQEGGREYAVIEYIEGSCLREMMARKDVGLDSFLSDIVVELAAAIEHVHDNGFMHLDIKPENIIVSREGTSYLCDFDTSQLIPVRPTKIEKKSGTPFYMSPELTKGWRLDHRADIYAFGVTVYELLTGIKPFEGQTQKAMFRELQWDTFGITLNHFDLLRIDAKQRIEIEIPIELRGTAPGTNSGGALEQPLHSIRIDCLAVEVPEKLTVRINHLEIGDSVTAGEIEIDSDANLLLEPDAIVVRVVEIREEEEEEVLEDGEFESGPIEPEVIGRAVDEDDSDEDE